MFTLIIIASLGLLEVHSKVYDRCELAQELLQKHEAPRQQIPIWVCIADHESRYNTSAVGTINSGSKDHGLFQISDLYWCSPPGKGWACGVTCAELEDDDIEDDFICAKRIYREHKKLTGDGFNAWAVYQTHCSGGRAETYVQGCFDKPDTAAISTSSTVRPTVSTESRLISAVRPKGFGISNNGINTVVPKAQFQWFSQFGWS